MKFDKIEELRSGFPDIFDVKPVSEDWLDDVYIIDRHDNYPDPLADELFPDIENPVADMPDGIETIFEDELSIPGEMSDDDDVLTDTNRRLREKLGDDFPGGPSDKFWGPIPVIEVYGFYLPWHKFDKDIWGIYIFAEGIELLGKFFNILSKNQMPVKECNLLARAFIFHHEAYHNKVESFSARLEVVLRSPIFNTSTCNLYHSKGFRLPYTSTLPTTSSGLFHEESLANAYASMMCRDVFSKYPKNQKKNLQQLASQIIYKLIKDSPPKYRDAEHIIFDPWHHRDSRAASERRFAKVENEFKEQILQGSGHLLPPNAMLWATQTRLMDPTLQRNSSFSYLINKKSKLAGRLKHAVHYIPRRKLIKYLEDKTGGIEQVSGSRSKHPRKFVVGSQRIPIPGNRNDEIAIGTAKSILKTLGIYTNDEQLRRDL